MRMCYDIDDNNSRSLPRSPVDKTASWSRRTRRRVGSDGLSTSSSTTHLRAGDDASLHRYR